MQYHKYTEALQNIEVIRKSEETIGRENLVEAGGGTFGPVHFINQQKTGGFGVKQLSSVKVDLDENLRGRVERFQIAESPNKHKNDPNSDSKERHVN